MRDKLLSILDDQESAEQARREYADQVVRLGVQRLYGVYIRRKHGQFWLYLGQHSTKKPPRRGLPALQGSNGCVT